MNKNIKYDSSDSETECEINIEFSDNDSEYHPDAYKDLVQEILAEYVSNGSKRRRLNPPPAPKKKKRDDRFKGYTKGKPELNVSRFKIEKVDCIGDLIDLGKRWKVFKKQHSEPNGEPTRVETECNKIESIIPELKKFDDMIGMTNLKKTITNQILYSVQDLHGQDMMNMVITGPPGTGKSTVGELLGHIYKKIGLLSKGTFNVARRSDLIDKYQGGTVYRTEEFLKGCIGGVIFIDEAYSLSSGKDNDEYGRECLNRINQFLSEERDVLCIIAGYKENIEREFFGINPGLSRRFPWRFDIKKYTANELCDIFLFRMKRSKWKLGFRKLDKLYTLFKTHYQNMENQGGDCENILNRSKIAQSRRMFTESETQKQKGRFKLIFSDIKEGFSDYLKDKTSKNETWKNIYI